MTSQDALRALTPQQAADLGELDEIADTAAAMADLAQLELDAAQGEYEEASQKRDDAAAVLAAAQRAADDARRRASYLRADLNVVRTASGYITRDEAARQFRPQP